MISSTLPRSVFSFSSFVFLLCRGCICFSNSLSIISRRQIDETTIDPLELLKNLKGWTVKKYKCTETNGRYRVDKTYRHPKSKKWLRSLCKVREFILDSSYTGKASDNGEGGTQTLFNLFDTQLVKITGFFGLKFGEFGVMSIGDFHNLQFSKLKLPY
ncbi:uncharacterized protein LOC110895994 isoform X4 [Helianthus annuus]|uniref:uncharacterized protein LOC110895994 isoform X4 n=1 Tax=Helianthus annuus TaxID=4232 RepID=UPI0016532F9C|nr:uncharacterized protein LOC110895994 isoform X4 [Helianthus annuus]